MSNATPTSQPLRMQPFATWDPTRGIWQTAQLDLCGLWEPACRPRGYVDRCRRAAWLLGSGALPVNITIGRVIGS